MRVESDIVRVGILCGWRERGREWSQWDSVEVRWSEEGRCDRRDEGR